jgi:hypothetical protein
MNAIEGQPDPREDRISDSAAFQGPLEIDNLIRRTANEAIAVVGPAMIAALQDRRSLEAFFAAADPETATHATVYLNFVWDPKTHGKHALWWDVLLHSANQDLRAKAVYMLGAVYHKTREPVIGELFAMLVCDSQEHADVRKAAYLALLRVCPHQALFEAPDRYLSARVPEDIDWQYVRSFFSGESLSAPEYRSIITSP